MRQGHSKIQNEAPAHLWPLPGCCGCGGSADAGTTAAGAAAAAAAATAAAVATAGCSLQGIRSVRVNGPQLLPRLRWAACKLLQVFLLMLNPG